MLPDDRFRHLYLIGQTGTGKSTLLLNLAAADIAAGRSVMLLDPHGDLCEHLLAVVPRPRPTTSSYSIRANGTRSPLNHCCAAMLDNGRSSRRP